MLSPTKLLLLFLTLSPPFTQSANILFFFGVSTYSHRITAWPLVTALAERGHNVTFLQAEKNKNPHPKVKEIQLQRDSLVGGLDFLKMKMQYGRTFQFALMHLLPSLGQMVCEETFKDTTFLKWMEANKNNVDLIVVDALFNDCALGIAHKLGAQTAVFGTSTVFEWWADDFGFPAENNWLATPHFGMDMPLSFPSRMLSTFLSLYLRFIKISFLYPKLEVLLKEKLNMPDMPPLTELASGSSLVLMNTHFSEEVARSLPPLVVPVGGMHCSDKLTKLPKELEDFLTGAGPEGFIYVSFGSEVKIASGPPELRAAFFNAFKKLGQIRFLWKWEGERPKDMPSNVLTTSWVPQQSVLAHPKIRLFITHGGLLSIQEALYFPVPMISFPIFAEQDYNAERVHRTKRGIRMDITTVTAEDIETAIKTILTDDTYMNSVKRASKLFKDRPQKPVDTAVWWVEYILRNKDAASVLSPVLSANQWWFQRRNLDVWGLVFIIILLILAINFFVLKTILSFCFRQCRGGKRKNANDGSDKTKIKKDKIKKQ